ncbi:MAG: endonuclease [Myxococcota bacterium]
MAKTKTSQQQKRIVKALLDRYGQTYAEEIGIKVEGNKPAALFQLLVASLMFSTRISAGNASRAVKALKKAKLTTPKKMAEATWQQRVDVITWHGYKRYDESTATRLGQTSELLLDKYKGDLRRLREEAERDVRREHELLKQFKGVGDLGAGIFLREIQHVWTEAYPYADKRVVQAAERLGLPKDEKKLAKLVSQKQFPTLVAALVRVQLDKGHEQVLEAA